MADVDWTKFPKVRQAMDYFQSQGWSPQQAAGIVANLHSESGLQEDNNTGDNGKAYGIGQWHAPRQQQFQNWADKPIQGSSFEDQLGFVQHELTSGWYRGAGDKLQDAQNPADAAAIVSNSYEQPADTNGQKAWSRGTKAEDIYKALFPAPPAAGQQTSPQTVTP